MGGTYFELVPIVPRKLLSKKKIWSRFVSTSRFIIAVISRFPFASQLCASDTAALQMAPFELMIYNKGDSAKKNQTYRSTQPE